MAWEITTQSDISELTVSLTENALASLQNESLFAPGGLLHGLMWFKQLPLGSKSDQYNRMNSQTAGRATDGIDYAASGKLNPTGTAVTATEAVVIVTLTDYARASSIQDLGQAAGREMGFAMANLWDAEVMALHTSFNSEIGTSGSALTLAIFDEGQLTLYKAKHGGPYWAVLHPNQWKNLLTQTTLTLGSNTGGPGTILDNVTRTYFLVDMGLHDTFVAVSNNVPTGNSAAAHSGAVYSGDPAVGCVMQTHPDTGGPWLNVVGIQRDESYRAREVVMTSSWGVAEVDGTAAVACETDYAA